MNSILFFPWKQKADNGNTVFIDAPALAVADVGVAMGAGAALAMEMSDVTLMDSDVNLVLQEVLAALTALKLNVMRAKPF